MRRITEQDVIDGWARWGDGTPLKEGFAAWLAAELNRDAFTIRHIAPPVASFVDGDQTMGIAGFTTEIQLTYKR